MKKKVDKKKRKLLIISNTMTKVAAYQYNNQIDNSSFNHQYNNSELNFGDIQTNKNIGEMNDFNNYNKNKINCTTSNEYDMVNTFKIYFISNI